MRNLNLKKNIKTGKKNTILNKSNIHESNFMDLFMPEYLKSNSNPNSPIIPSNATYNQEKPYDPGVQVELKSGSGINWGTNHISMSDVLDAMAKSKEANNSPSNYTNNPVKVVSMADIMANNNPYVSDQVIAKEKENKLLEESTKSMWDNLESDRKKQTLFGGLGYAAQGLSAVNDLINNSNQPDVPGTPMMIPHRIGYRDVDIEPYNRRMDQTIAAYKKYLMETGNASMIPSIIGDVIGKENEYNAQITQQNNQGRTQVDQFNAQAETQADQVNLQTAGQDKQLQMAANQYKDQAIRSNKQTLFGSIAGIGKTLGGSSSQKLKLDAIQSMITSGQYSQAMASINELLKVNPSATNDPDFMSKLGAFMTSYMAKQGGE